MKLTALPPARLCLLGQIFTSQELAFDTKSVIFGYFMGDYWEALKK
jgi:hypothetical protein